MNENDAHRILGIPRSAGLYLAEQAYRQQSRNLQRRIVPGLPLSVRQKAQQDLIQMTSAWNTLKAAKTSWKQRNTSVKQSTTAQRPHGLADNWEGFFSLFPFSRPVLAAVAATAFVAGVFLVHQFMKGF